MKFIKLAIVLIVAAVIVVFWYMSENKSQESDNGKNAIVDNDDSGQETDDSDIPVCDPECTGKECGFDGCFGLCGTCDDGYECRADACEPIITDGYLWSKRFGSSDNDTCNSLTVDSNGNVFTTGVFQETVDFGGGSLTSAGKNDIFLAKYDADGNHIFSKRFGSMKLDFSDSVSVNNDDNVFVTGSFEGTVDFGGGPLTSAGKWDIFLMKFSADGNHIWSKRFGFAAFSGGGNSVSVDSKGNVFLTGIFEGTVDFGGAPLTSAGENDIFLAKYDADGNHIFSRRFGSVGRDNSRFVSVDSKGNVFMTGDFEDAVDFGGGALTSSGYDEIFLAKYDANGNHIWSKQLGSYEWAIGCVISVDSSDNVFVTGSFQGTFDFGGGALTSKNYTNIFLVKYDADGNHLFSKRFDSSGFGTSSSISVDSNDNVFMSGHFLETIDFGGGSLTSKGHLDIFLVKFDSLGNHLLSKRFGSSGNDINFSMSVDNNDNVFMTGVFWDTIDFGGDTFTSAGKRDIFLIKYSF